MRFGEFEIILTGLRFAPELLVQTGRVVFAEFGVLAVGGAPQFFRFDEGGFELVLRHQLLHQQPTRGVRDLAQRGIGDLTQQFFRPGVVATADQVLGVKDLRMLTGRHRIRQGYEMSEKVPRGIEVGGLLGRQRGVAGGVAPLVDEQFVVLRHELEKLERRLMIALLGEQPPRPCQQPRPVGGIREVPGVKFRRRRRPGRVVQ